MLCETWETGQVTRYHANPKLSKTNQTVADHSWGVATILCILHPNPPRELIFAALIHDCGERFAGDLPYPFKAAFPDFAEAHAELEAQLADQNNIPSIEWMDDEARAWLNLCDRLESFIFMRHNNVSWTNGDVEKLLVQAHALGASYHVQQLIGGI